jgi:hypothetical protein
MDIPALPEVEIIAENAGAWGSSLQPQGCRICRQVFLTEPQRAGGVCPNCAQGKLERQPALVQHEPPELVVPFRQGRAEVQALLGQFVKDIWLKPQDMKLENLLQRVQPVFWPMWLVDSTLSGDWKAEVGYDYQVKSSRESYDRGGWVTNEVIEDRIRWEPRLGMLERRYENITVPALEDHKALSILLGRYDRQQSQPFSPAGIRSSLLRLPDQTPEEAWPAAQAEIKAAAGEECSRAASGQHIRNFAIHARYQDLNWTLLLLPMYATYYTADDGVQYPIFINGQSGVAGGVRLASQRLGWIWGGALAGAGLFLFLIAALLALLVAVFPPAAVLSGLAGAAGLALLGAALVPIFWPWQWNRRQRRPGAKTQ